MNYMLKKSLLASCASFALASSFMFAKNEAPDKCADVSNQQLSRQLYDINAVKFGDFLLNVIGGQMRTPIYLDMRLIRSYPPLLKQVIDRIADKAEGLTFDYVSGVPFASFVFADCYGMEYQKPLIMPRKEIKGYGMSKPIEGEYTAGKTVLIVEDVTVSGRGILETVQTLRREGLHVTDAIVVCDRGQGAKENLAKEGITLHVILSLDELLEAIYSDQKIDTKTKKSVEKFIAEHQTS